MNELKNCPFCGEKSRTITDVDMNKYPSSFVECSKCGCSTKTFRVDHEYHQISRQESANMAKIKAIEMWNNRVESLAEIERLQSKCKLCKMSVKINE